MTMKDALVATSDALPASFASLIDLASGKEMSAHTLLTAQIGMPVYFGGAKSPWQRGSNDHLNGLLRQYFPKGTHLSRWSAEEIAATANAINNRPRGILGWRPPAEVFTDQLRSSQQTTVATTG